MPRTLPTKNEERRRAVRAIISSGLDMMNSDEDKLAAAMGCKRRTLQNRRKSPDTLSLGEFWRICDYLQVPDRIAVYLLLGKPVEDISEP